MSQQAQIFPAATVLLLRDGLKGLEVFMVERHHKIDAFSGALVFPGGKVDPEDGDTSLLGHCRDAEHLTPEQLTYRVAALREAFEECGVLLARPSDSEVLINAERLADLEQRYRQPLLDNTLGMAELCRAENLELATDQLSYYAHWITPKVRPKQFDTHFFLAPAPADQIALHDGKESLSSHWIRPQDAIARAEVGKLTVVFPTRMNLLKLARSASVQEALNAAQTDTIMTVQPIVEAHADGQIMNIPPQAGYAASRVFVPKDGIRFSVLA